VTTELQATAAALLAAMRRDTGLDDLAYAVEPTPVGGGFWAEILTFRLAGAAPPFAGGLVAKIMPSRLLGDREALVQAAVADQSYAAPQVLVHGTGPRNADGCYFVMPRVEGAPPLAAVNAAALVRSVPSLALRLPTMLAELAARLHSLDPAPLRDALATEPGWPIDVNDLVADISAAADRVADAELATAIRTMLAARPEPANRDVICHGDFHPLNIVVGPAGATVLDWTAARLGPPAFDVAFTALLLAHPPIQVGPAFDRPLHIAGRWLARRFITGYRRRARAAGWDLPPEELSWYTQLHSARILLDVAERGDAASDHPFAMLTEPTKHLLVGSGTRARG
jgi:aminoglycoside phosphotransferase (APT) family kinase protein